MRQFKTQHTHWNQYIFSRTGSCVACAFVFLIFIYLYFKPFALCHSINFYHLNDRSDDSCLSHAAKFCESWCFQREVEKSKSAKHMAQWIYLALNILIVLDFVCFFLPFSNDQETYGAQIYKHFIGKNHWTWEANIWWQPVTTSMETRRTHSAHPIIAFYAFYRNNSDTNRIPYANKCLDSTMHAYTIESSIFITHASWQTRSCTQSIEVNDSSEKKTLKNRCNWQGLQHPIQTATNEYPRK